MQYFALFEPVNKLSKKPRAVRGFRATATGRIKEPASVLRLVQIIPQTAGVLLPVEIHLLPRGVHLRRQLLQLDLLMSQTQLDVIERCAQVRGFGAAQKTRKQSVAALEPL